MTSNNINWEYQKDRYDAQIIDDSNDDNLEYINNSHQRRKLQSSMDNKINLETHSHQVRKVELKKIKMKKIKSPKYSPGGSSSMKKVKKGKKVKLSKVNDIMCILRDSKGKSSSKKSKGNSYKDYDDSYYNSTERKRVMKKSEKRYKVKKVKAPKSIVKSSKMNESQKYPVSPPSHNPSPILTQSPFIPTQSDELDENQTRTNSPSQATYGKGKGKGKSAKTQYPYCDEVSQTDTPSAINSESSTPSSLSLTSNPSASPVISRPTTSPNPTSSPAPTLEQGIYRYNEGRCPAAGSFGVPCASDTNIRKVCNRYDEEFGSFRKCWEICKPAFCCIHDAPSDTNILAPSCSRDENCAQYAYCYIVWFKFHDTFGPATYLNVQQEGNFFDVPNEEVRGDKFGDEFFDQLYFHHFDNSETILEAGTVNDEFQSDRIFEDPEFWDNNVR